MSIANVLGPWTGFLRSRARLAFPKNYRVRPSRKVIEDAKRPEPPDDYEDIVTRCWSDGTAGPFVHFVGTHCRIYDRARKLEVPFRLWPGQNKVAEALLVGDWLLVLKGRQVGLTWMLAAYVLWRLLFTPMWAGVVVNQRKEYAQDFIRRVLYMYWRLPWWMRVEWTTRNKGELRCEVLADSKLVELRSVVSGPEVVRSTTLDFMLIDEAAYVRELAATLHAATPAIESCKGQLICNTTAAGPGDDFHSLWLETTGETGELLKEDGKGPTGYRPVFLRWDERPGRRTAEEIASETFPGEWYEEQARRLDRISPIAVKREYPMTWMEAFEYGEGRFYPTFTRERVVSTIGVPDTAERYRAIDWGESKSAYVVLWIAHVRSLPGALLVHPGCLNTIREHMGYRRDDKTGRPVKSEDHTCDALRYAVVTFGMTGLVYVYRELYIKNSVAEGWSFTKDAVEIHEQSGWVFDEQRGQWRPGPKGERYTGTVADRALGKAINEFNANGIPCVGHARIKREDGMDGASIDAPYNEVLDGIKAVSTLLDGSEDIAQYIEVERSTPTNLLMLPLISGKERQKPSDNRKAWAARRLVDRVRKRRRD